MFWKNGCIYRGYWDLGVQNGLGMMIFADGMRKAGFFQKNVYSAPLKDIDQF